MGWDGTGRGNRGRDGIGTGTGTGNRERDGMGTGTRIGSRNRERDWDRDRDRTGTGWGVGTRNREWDGEGNGMGNRDRDGDPARGPLTDRIRGHRPRWQPATSLFSSFLIFPLFFRPIPFPGARGRSCGAREALAGRTGIPPLKKKHGNGFFSCSRLKVPSGKGCCKKVATLPCRNSSEGSWERLWEQGIPTSGKVHNVEPLPLHPLLFMILVLKLTLSAPR
ncbi:uncharacterized protein LOC113971687 [Neopelma chrysocephalum]|uniref:uncharacterized protein LOC113971687 n=1 Tax=Neopelma chrysocephalum TaxID=114329 RepID=UPI000FCD2A30|nr:uncharacterized protein LOC113971687 [Neopelma chrysocephalum]